MHKQAVKEIWPLILMLYMQNNQYDEAIGFTEQYAYYNSDAALRLMHLIQDTAARSGKPLSAASLATIGGQADWLTKRKAEDDARIALRNGTDPASLAKKAEAERAIQAQFNAKRTQIMALIGKLRQCNRDFSEINYWVEFGNRKWNVIERDRLTSRCGAYRGQGKIDFPRDQTGVDWENFQFDWEPAKPFGWH